MKFKQGDKVTIPGIGFGYVNEILADDTYYIYIANKKISGGGYIDDDLELGWPKNYNVNKYFK